MSGVGDDVGEGIGDGVGDDVGDNVGDDVGDNNVGDGVGLRRIAPLGFRSFFLQKSGSEMTCQVDGNRRRLVVGKGLVVPCVYVFRGKQEHLVWLISVFAKLEVPS